MAIERTVIIPDVDNDGRSLASEQAAFEDRLLDIAGGFTSEQVRGAWRDSDGTVYRDHSIRYTVCLDEQQDARLLACLPDVCASCRQEALFTASRPADVTFIEQPVLATSRS